MLQADTLHELESTLSGVVTRPRVGGRVARSLGVVDGASPVVAPVEQASGVSRPWMRTYVGGLLLAEGTVAGLVGLLHEFSGVGGAGSPASVSWASVVVVVLWPVLLGLCGGYASRSIGAGRTEYSAVLTAGVTTMALVGSVSYGFQLELSRQLVVVAVPGLVLGSLLVRFAARHRLRVLRSRGRCTRAVVVVGRGGAVLSLVERLRAEPAGGLTVVGTAVTVGDRTRVGQATGLPVAGLDEVLDLARRTGAEAVAVTSASETAAEYLRSLSWQLEGTGLELLVAPGLIEVAGPRLHIRPFEGLPLLAVEQPRFEGWRRVVKGVLDRGLAVLGLVVLSPLLLGLAAWVALDSRGPVLYLQERVGKDGRLFRMVKFRSMVTDAEAQVAALSSVNESDGVLFKIKADPRITRAGRVLRRLSLDELPQLVNVATGAMSLVGPRPPLPREVARYDGSVSRRLLVKPGLTGLWQVSGRSDLSWEESVRLDLRYVENWSLPLDALILWRTARAVLSSRGAY